MRTKTGTLDTHLATGLYELADLYEIDVWGTTYRLTSCDRNITGIAPASTAVYSSTGAMFQRDRVRQSDGLQVDDLELVLAHGGTATLGSKTWVKAALDGDLDGAPFRLYRAYLDKTTFAMIGGTLLFSGRVAVAEPSSTEARIVVSVPSKTFNSRFPATVLQPNCVWALGDAGCGYAGTLSASLTVASGSTSTVVRFASLPGGFPIAQFLNGLLTVGTDRRAITAVAAAGDGSSWAPPSGYAFRVFPPLPAASVTAGTTGTAYRSCPKTVAACLGTFNNLARFLGAPYAPTSKDAN